jgi:hypothetical protein
LSRQKKNYGQTATHATTNRLVFAHAHGLLQIRKVV